MKGGSKITYGFTIFGIDATAYAANKASNTNKRLNQDNANLSTKMDTLQEQNRTLQEQNRTLQEQNLSMQKDIKDVKANVQIIKDNQTNSSQNIVDTDKISKSSVLGDLGSLPTKF
jgi:uncharacterized protein YlxW (UPF0749 family)